MNVRAIYFAIKNTSFAYLLLFLPLIHFIFGLIIHYFYGYFYMDSRDPEYFHLISGIAMSKGAFYTSYIDHPGTPIQVVIALAALIVSFVSGEDMVTGAIANPEAYLFAANVLFNLIFAFVIYLVGTKTIRYSGKIWLGFIFQLTFFGSAAMLSVLGRLTPEGFMMIPLGLVVLLVTKYLFDEEANQRLHKYTLYFAILIGLGIATKLSFIGFAILPFVLLPGWRNKLKLVAFSIPSFLLFAFPVIFNFNRFLKWAGGMFLHSGKWGKGDSNIIDFSKMPERLQSLYRYDPWIFIISALVLIISIIVITSKRKDDFLLKYAKTGFSMVSAIVLMAFMLTKHWGLHYFMPTISLKIFLIGFIFLLLQQRFSNLYLKTYAPVFSLLIALFIAGNSIYQNGQKLNTSKISVQKKRLTDFHSYTSNEDIVIMSAHYAGAPYITPALADGFLLCKKAKEIFKTELAKVYSNHYMYFDWAENLFSWGEFLNTKQLLEKNKDIYFYVGQGKDKMSEELLNKFRKDNPGKIISLQLVVNNEREKEKLYQVNIEEGK